jgi:heptose I phosphotransferase
VIELREDLLQALPDGAFDRLLKVPGKVHREIANRRTVEFELAGRTYFIKAQFGCGWGEILKNLLYGRLPVVSARTEWQAIEALHEAGVPTLSIAGRGLRGVNPARLESFVVTDGLQGTISLEDLAKELPSLPARTRVLLKRALIGQVALIARRLHEAGLNHRDFYLCHFLVRDRSWADWTPTDSLDLVLIDLHRVQQRDRVPRRWLVKDLGGLLFSSLDAGLTSRDLLRFMEVYRDKPWRHALLEERDLWTDVWRNAVELYCPFHRREPPLHLKAP